MKTKGLLGDPLLTHVHPLFMTKGSRLQKSETCFDSEMSRISSCKSQFLSVCEMGLGWGWGWEEKLLLSKGKRIVHGSIPYSSLPK